MDTKVVGESDAASSGWGVAIDAPTLTQTLAQTQIQAQSLMADTSLSFSLDDVLEGESGAAGLEVCLCRWLCLGGVFTLPLNTFVSVYVHREL